MVYKVTYEYRPRYKEGRIIPRPTWKKETTTFRRKYKRGILRGAKSFEGHLQEVYGKQNVRKFKVKKTK